MRLNEILVPLDLSPDSGATLGYAIDVARRTGARLHLLHSCEPELSRPPPYLSMCDEQRVRIRDAAARKLLKAAQTAEREDIRVDTHLCETPPARAIHAVAERVGADLIIMGTHGSTGIRHALRGRVSGKTIRLAPCPVIALPAAS